ncbi:unnamed protein product [Linum tenue]|uniref:Nucleotidyl transferase domain-containing protein n=1 Tax=Linum tenue TaxID=586396 RepID=A0AAV0QVQ2_9ROSI|nr:unnamed protein product [Linum tenue]
MGGSEERVVAVIMVGGPTKGTRFRPLSLNIPKPLFPLAGQPMVHHPISACKRIPNLAQIYLVGFYEEREFALYVSAISNELRVPVRYLREDKPHGSAGGLYNFRDLIMEDNPAHIFLLNCDVCCSFPLPEMLGNRHLYVHYTCTFNLWNQLRMLHCYLCFVLFFSSMFSEAHKRYGGIGTLLVIKVSVESASQFGELVADPVTKELLHYTEKPETFVSDLINCGVYVFTPEIFTAIQGVSSQLKDRANLRRVSSFEALQSATRSFPSDFVRLDQDILSPLAGKKQLYTYETRDFWEQIKTPGNVAGTIVLSDSSLSLANETAMKQIGPNVSISANARIGPGARLISCIILDDVEVMENGVVINAIVGWKSSIGKWSRVQAEGAYNAKLGITILGEAVTVEDEVVVVNSIVLPHKTLNVSVQEEIIL